MTQTFTPITERIPLAPEVRGTVYTVWSPRSDSQSPDLRPPTDEFVSLASFFVHEADEAETQPVVDLAAVMPEPDCRPPGYRGTRRMVEPPRDPSWEWFALPTLGAVVHVLAQVALLQVAIKVSGAVL
jgi:hypothetical protein